jgi:hypothetical protein
VDHDYNNYSEDQHLSHTYMSIDHDYNYCHGCGSSFSHTYMLQKDPTHMLQDDPIHIPENNTLDQPSDP